MPPVKAVTLNQTFKHLYATLTPGLAQEELDLPIARSFFFLRKFCARQTKKIASLMSPIRILIAKGYWLRQELKKCNSSFVRSKVLKVSQEVKITYLIYQYK